MWSGWRRAESLALTVIVCAVIWGPVNPIDANLIPRSTHAIAVSRAMGPGMPFTLCNWVVDWIEMRCNMMWSALTMTTRSSFILRENRVEACLVLDKRNDECRRMRQSSSNNNTYKPDSIMNLKVPLERENLWSDLSCWPTSPKCCWLYISDLDLVLAVFRGSNLQNFLVDVQSQPISDVVSGCNWFRKSKMKFLEWY